MVKAGVQAGLAGLLSLSRGFWTGKKEARDYCFCLFVFWLSFFPSSRHSIKRWSSLYI